MGMSDELRAPTALAQGAPGTLGPEASPENLEQRKISCPG
jgi:hypothetical protein